jgi:hypothetical protein
MIISPLSANNEPHEAKRLAIDINTRKANSIEVEEIPIPERVGSQKIAEVLERYYREMPDLLRPFEMGKLLAKSIRDPHSEQELKKSLAIHLNSSNIKTDLKKDSEELVAILFGVLLGVSEFKDKIYEQNRKQRRDTNNRQNNRGSKQVPFI